MRTDHANRYTGPRDTLRTLARGFLSLALRLGARQYSERLYFAGL